jgi:hypothetical protein
MSEETHQAEPGYEAPAITDLGTVAELTLGKTGSLIPDTVEFVQGAPPT